MLFWLEFLAVAAAGAAIAAAVWRKGQRRRTPGFVATRSLVAIVLLAMVLVHIGTWLFEHNNFSSALPVFVTVLALAIPNRDLRDIVDRGWLKVRRWRDVRLARAAGLDPLAAGAIDDARSAAKAAGGGKGAMAQFAEAHTPTNEVLIVAAELLACALLIYFVGVRIAEHMATPMLAFVLMAVLLYRPTWRLYRLAVREYVVPRGRRSREGLDDAWRPNEPRLAPPSGGESGPTADPSGQEPKRYLELPPSTRFAIVAAIAGVGFLVSLWVLSALSHVVFNAGDWGLVLLGLGMVVVGLPLVTFQDGRWEFAHLRTSPSPGGS